MSTAINSRSPGIAVFSDRQFPGKLALLLLASISAPNDTLVGIFIIVLECVKLQFGTF